MRALASHLHSPLPLHHRPLPLRTGPGNPASPPCPLRLNFCGSSRRKMPRAGTVCRSGPGVESAIVVGGGLGGLAAALSLRRVGVEAQVYEKRESIGGGEGTLILISPNGLHALAKIQPDIVPKLMEAGAVSPRSFSLAKDGSVLTGSPMGSDAGEREGPKDGLPFICISWSATLQILKDLLPPDAIRTGHAFLGLSQEEDSVKATFQRADGSEVSVSSELLVGSDGIRSEVRRALFGINSQEHIVDLKRTLWRGMVSWDKCTHPSVQKGCTHFYMGGDRIATLADAGSNQLYIAFTVLDTAWPDGVPKRSADGEESLAVLRSFFEGVSVAEHALAILEPSEILERRVLECPVLERWSQGNAILIGDAAHALPPSVGQGANTAFEDAWELGEALASPSSLRGALEEFESARIPRTKYIADINKAFGNAAYKTKGPGAEGAAKETDQKPPESAPKVSPTAPIYDYRGHGAWASAASVSS